MPYVRRQPNGTVVLCRADKADGFLNTDRSQIFAFAGSAISGDYPAGEIEKISVGEFMAEAKAPLEEKMQLLADCILEISETVYS